MKWGTAPGWGRVLGQTRRVDDRDVQLIRIDAGGWGLTWAVDGAGTLRQVGLGGLGHVATVDVDPFWYPMAFPTFGGGDPFVPAPLRVTHHDGTFDDAPRGRRRPP